MADISILTPASPRAKTMLDEGWTLRLAEPGEYAAPAQLDHKVGWIAAVVPGTAAAALEHAGLFARDAPIALDDHDVWYRIKLDRIGPHTLRFAGLATIAEVWLGDDLILQSENMFLRHEIEIDLIAGEQLTLCFRSLSRHLARPGKRARWRPRMVQPSSLNTVRTTLLGHVPGWCPSITPVGPWKAIELVQRDDACQLHHVGLHATIEGNAGIVRCALDVKGAPPTLHLHCAGISTAFTRPDEGSHRWEAVLTIDNPALWWPHTHGAPTLHPIELTSGVRRTALGSVGFRTIEIERGADGKGFAVRLNGVNVFCRGACWTPLDIVALPQDRAAYEPRLQQAVEAGFNMLRVGGTMVYEGKAFYDLCDELGIMVWQDFMFANFDYPSGSDDFIATVRQEAAQFLHDTASNASIAVLCGGSEVYQQAAMLGLPEKSWRNPLFEDVLPSLCKASRGDVPYVVNSPSDGVLPFMANTGVAHYYGVGAYMRPLDDARRANVRFASECLAFANIGDETSVWNEGVPRDAGADWDFADIRDHYLERIYGVDASGLRERDLDRYLELSRASTAHVMSETLAEWRRCGSSNAGALIWFLADLAPGSGWGLVASRGEPKSVWHAVRRTCQPVQIVLIDEGVNGLYAHIINETSQTRRLTVRIACLREGVVPVVDGSRTVEIAAHSQIELSATELFGGFFDVTNAYRFGPPSHDVVVAELLDADTNELLSSDSYFPLGLANETHELGLRAEVSKNEEGWLLSIRAMRFAQFVQVKDRYFVPSDNWFHLAPGRTQTVELRSRADETATPQGLVRAVNGRQAVAYHG